MAGELVKRLQHQQQQLLLQLLMQQERQLQPQPPQQLQNPFAAAPARPTAASHLPIIGKASTAGGRQSRPAEVQQPQQQQPSAAASAQQLPTQPQQPLASALRLAPPPVLQSPMSTAPSRLPAPGPQQPKPAAEATSAKNSGLQPAGAPLDPPQAKAVPPQQPLPAPQQRPPVAETTAAGGGGSRAGVLPEPRVSLAASSRHTGPPRQSPVLVNVALAAGGSGERAPGVLLEQQPQAGISASPAGKVAPATLAERQTSLVNMHTKHHRICTIAPPFPSSTHKRALHAVGQQVTHGMQTYQSKQMKWRSCKATRGAAVAPRI
jgi:hypothetical protein